MTLPKKGSRKITVDDNDYRWILRRQKEGLRLVVQSAGGSGPLLQVYFEPHDLYRHAEPKGWTVARQGRAVGSGAVATLIRHALRNGWKPGVEGQPPMRLYEWDVEKIAPDMGTPAACPDEVPLQDIAIQQVSDLRYDLSLDPGWRARLFDAEPHQKLDIPPDYSGIGAPSRRYGLRYQVFNDGVTEDGFVVFGIQSVEYPGIVMYTTNNPEIL